MSQMNSPTPRAGSHAVEAGMDVAGDARDRAADVAGHAGEAVRDIAREAGEQVRDVASEAKLQAGRLVDQARTEVSAQASVQQERVARGLRGLGAELDRMSSAAADPGYASDLAQRGSQLAGRLAGWFEQREPGDVMREVADFARRRPGVFLAVAAGAGVAAGRFLRGAQESGPDAGATGYRAARIPTTSAATPAGVHAARERSAGLAAARPADDAAVWPPDDEAGWPSGDASDRPTGGAGYVPGI